MSHVMNTYARLPVAFTHGDGVWPHSDKYIKEQFAEVPAEQVKMITCTNAGKFYGLIN